MKFILSRGLMVHLRVLDGDDKAVQGALVAGVRAAPTLFLIDRQGVLRQADLEVNGLEARLEEFLKP